MANPTGMTVHGGSATATSSGSQLTVTTTSQRRSLNWQSFNIAAGETTIFNQPSATSIVWNRINDQNPSQIYGSLQANGIVVLLNSSGFYFGPNSFVSAAGLVVSTANCAAAAKYRRRLGIQRSAAAREHRQLRTNQNRQWRLGISHCR